MPTSLLMISRFHCSTVLLHVIPTTLPLRISSSALPSTILGRFFSVVRLPPPLHIQSLLPLLPLVQCTAYLLSMVSLTSSILVCILDSAINFWGHSGHDYQHEVAERSEYLKQNTRSLAHCAAEVKSPGHEAANLKRRKDRPSNLDGSLVLNPANISKPVILVRYSINLITRITPISASKIRQEISSLTTPPAFFNRTLRKALNMSVASCSVTTSPRVRRAFR